MRIEIPGDPISVVYGYDGMAGVFLSVIDKRLAHNLDSSDEVNAVAESIGVGDGGGSYLNLHTGRHGFGTKVDDNTMAAFLKRYDVTADRISELPLRITDVIWQYVEPGTSTREVGSMKVCTSCRAKTRSCKDCAKCRTVPYCGKECQKKDWGIHNIFCGLHGQSPLPPNNSAAAFVKAFLFPESSEVPVFVNLPLVHVEGDEDDVTSRSFIKLNCDEFITGSTDKIQSDRFTDLSIRSLPQAYHMICKSDSRIDGSEINKCVLNLFKKYEKKSGSMSVPTDPFWRNNILVVKAEPEGLETDSYQDISIADATEVVKFLYKYTSSHGLIVH